MSDYPEKMWRKLKGAAGAVKSLEPYLLSRKKAPEIHVENRGKANIRARAWQAENGKICLVVAGVGGGRSEAVITVPGKENLKSVYGRTIPLGRAAVINIPLMIWVPIFCSSDLPLRF